jgi:hypothetical protein
LSTEEATHNGAAPADPLAPIIEQLQEQLAPIAAERGQLEAALADAMRREERIKGAISALRSGAPRRPPAPKPATATEAKVWQPKQETVDRVYAAFAEAGEPMTIAQVHARTGGSTDTIRKSIDVLRRQEKLRLCGTAASQGSPRLFGVMPS